jgi:outer membrane receptor protein involved in Fe transport
VYSTSLIYNFQPAASYTNTITNSNLEPSFSSAWETGMDVKFIQNRVGLDVTYFESLDGLVFITCPFRNLLDTSALVNGIKTKRKGWELVLKGSPFANPQGFSWDIMVNLVNVSRIH